MIGFDHIKELALKTPSKIVLLVMDGLGGLPASESGRTELEMANTPNLDQLAAKSVCGLHDPISPGITPGSGPAHLALFGYDPLLFDIGRGILETLGIDFDLEEKDLAARGNFCTVDEKGLVVDRRAGRIPTEKSTELCQLLSKLNVDGVQLFVNPVKEHRFSVVFRGDGLSPELTESDPQQVGVAPKAISTLSPGAERTARLVNQFVDEAKAALAESYPANMVLLRGFSKHPNLPKMAEVYRLNPAAIATYPMYRGLAKLVGMKTLATGESIEAEFATLCQHYEEHDFFFMHVKRTDSAGEDGNFEAKVSAIEEVDANLPQLMTLAPDVIVVTGDHSTPAMLGAHSWHPVPLLLHSRWCRPDGVSQFSERACMNGSLGRLPAVELMPLAMAYALKLTKFGA